MSIYEENRFKQYTGDGHPYDVADSYMFDNQDRHKQRLLSPQRLTSVSETVSALSVRGPPDDDSCFLHGEDQDRHKQRLLSPQRLTSVSETVSALSVRGPPDDDSCFLHGEDSEFLAEASFAGDADEHIKDPCAICFTNRNYSKEATHFCSECGLLGHFLCKQCLDFHKKFTSHKQVKSFVAAKYKKGGSLTETQTELDNEKEKVKQVKQDLSEKNTRIKELTVNLQAANVRLKVLRFQLQLNEDMK